MHLLNLIKCFTSEILLGCSASRTIILVLCELMARTPCITSKNFVNFRYDTNRIWKVWCWNPKSFHRNLTINPAKYLHMCYNTHTLNECMQYIFYILVRIINIVNFSNSKSFQTELWEFIFLSPIFLNESDTNWSNSWYAAHHKVLHYFWW